MSVIQKIRDKYARVAVVAIALALLGFILMDAFAGRSSLFGGRGNTLGKINGKKIEYETFNRRVNEISRAQGPNAGDLTPQIVSSLWDQEVQNEIMGEQYEELGLTVSDKELEQMMYSPTPSDAVRQAFGNPQSWDPAALRQRINQIKKSGSPEERRQLEEVTDVIVKQTLQNKYMALLTNSVYVPKWFLDKRSADNSQMARGAYVSVPYTSIADSTVKVTDAEILDYANAHKKDYESKEETRSVSYVQFNATPSSADSAAVRTQLTAAKDSLQAAADVKAFASRNRNVKYVNEFFSAKDYQWLASMAANPQSAQMLMARGLPVLPYPLQNSDSLFKSPAGAVTGPYTEPGYFVLAKITDRKTMPDTVKLRHILVALNDPQAGTVLRDSVVAKRIADSVQAVINGGANFDSVALKVSDDPGSKFRGGVYDSITRQSGFVPEFADFVFNKPVGSKGIVKTPFGYHYVEVLSHRGSSEVFKLALMDAPIEASRETQDRITEAANQFAANAKDEKSFKEYFDKNIKGKNLATSDVPSVATLRAMDFGLPTLNSSARSLVRKIFEAKKGDVLDPETVGTNTIVAVVTDVSEAGIPSATSLRPQIEPLLVNKKKAAKIKEQMGKVSDLNAVATKFNQPVQPADSVSFAGGNVLGFEAKVLGALFNPANKGKTVADPIVGNAGVYALRVDATFNTPVDKAAIEQQRQIMEMQGRRQGSPVELLKKRVTIKDNRAEFY